MFWQNGLTQWKLQVKDLCKCKFLTCLNAFTTNDVMNIYSNHLYLRGKQGKATLRNLTNCLCKIEVDCWRHVDHATFDKTN